MVLPSTCHLLTTTVYPGQRLREAYPEGAQHVGVLEHGGPRERKGRDGAQRMGGVCRCYPLLTNPLLTTYNLLLTSYYVSMP